MRLPTPPGMEWPPVLPPALRYGMYAKIYQAALKENAELEIIAEENNVYTLKITWPNKDKWPYKPSRALYYLRPV